MKGIVFCKAFLKSLPGFSSKAFCRRIISLSEVKYIALIFLMLTSPEVFSLTSSKTAKPGALCYMINNTISFTISGSSPVPPNSGVQLLAMTGSAGVRRLSQNGQNCTIPYPLPSRDVDQPIES